MARSALYGLVVECDVELPGLPSPQATGAPDVRVHLGSRPPEAESWPTEEHAFYRSPETAGRSPALVADRPGDGRFIRLRYAEGIRFHVTRDGTAVWSDWDAPLTVDDALTFLLGPVLGLVLRKRGVLAVHASAVVHDGAAWAFVGPGGAGKSTLGAALAANGFPVLTEDVLALRCTEGAWRAWPAYDHVRLWGDSPSLPPGAPALPTLSPTWEKRRLALDATARATAPVPLAGWFLLDERRSDESVAAPRIEPLVGAAALRALVANSYVGYLVAPDEQAAELVQLAALAAATEARRLAVAEGVAGHRAAVEAVARLIRAHGTDVRA